MDRSYIPIANIALGHLGEDDRIDDPNEASRPARAVKRAWELTRLFVLAEGHFSFACRTVDLTQRAPDPDWPIALGRVAYLLPADLVKFIEIVQPDCLDDHGDRYTIEGGPNGLELLVDPLNDPITIRYVRDGLDVADPSRWPPAFTEAFAFRLAWQISDELGADKARKDRVLNASERALKLALKENSRTKAPKRQHDGDWVTARRGFGSRAPGVAY